MKRDERIQQLIDANKVYGDFDVDENLKELYEKEYSDFNLHKVEYSFDKTGFSVLINAFEKDDEQLLNVKEIRKDFKWHECNAAWIDYLMSDECMRLKGPGFTFETFSHKLNRASAKAFYDQTQNPMFLWDIYSICRKAKLKIPEYVYEYFDRGAYNLNELRKDKSKGKPGDKIADALEMRVKDSTYHNVYYYMDLAKKHNLIHSIVKNFKSDCKELSDFEKLRGESVFDLAQKKLKKDFGYSVSTKRIDDIYYDQKILIKEENKREKEKREERISALQKKK